MKQVQSGSLQQKDGLLGKKVAISDFSLNTKPTSLIVWDFEAKTGTVPPASYATHSIQTIYGLSQLSFS
jgi:hypothetical protein